jgi:hypothetical protein
MAKVQDLLRIIKRGIILDLEMSSFSTMLRCHQHAENIVGAHEVP